MHKSHFWLSLFLTLGLLTGCSSAPNNTNAQDKKNQYNTTVQKNLQKESGNKLLSFNSCKDLQSTLKEHFKKEKKQQPNYLKSFGGEVMMEATASMDKVAAPTNLAGASKKQSQKHSQTNIQEAGVDEADIIKNDGKYIYLIRKNSIRIIETENGKLNPIANFKVDKEEFYPREIYLDKNTLTVIGNYSETIKESVETENEPIIEDLTSSFMSKAQAKRMMPGIMPPYYPQYKQMTTAVTFDISDKSNPKQVRMVSVEGNYQSSRKIKDIVYLVTNKYQDNIWYKPMPIRPFPMPVFRDSAFGTEKVVAECGNVDYVPNFESPNYLIVAAIDTKDTAKKVGRKMILGSGNQIYASTNNLYVTRSKYGHWFQPKQTPTTEIYKFGLEDTNIEFKEKSEVIGTVLNQFSMSEDAQGFFRIATQENQKGARLTILDKNLEQTGVVKHIAPGENIKSMRFMGDKGYLVTFKNVDPLFVIDLTPSNPKILGKLKIPGWSDYLHPYKENYLIGIGKEVSPEAEQKKRLTSADVLGVKLSIFDVSDLNNPKEIWKTIIGEQGSFTEALHNHKAFLFDAQENLLALPMTVNMKDGPKRNNWQPNKTVFKGAYVYDVSVKDGFKLRGTATHYQDGYWKDSSSSNRRYGNHEFDIQRIIFIGNNFYTIAPNIVASHSWDKVKKQSQIQLDQKKCEEIYEEMECKLNTQCKTIQKEWEECSIDNKTFTKSCNKKTQFLRCESK